MWPDEIHYRNERVSIFRNCSITYHVKTAEKNFIFISKIKDTLFFNLLIHLCEGEFSA